MPPELSDEKRQKFDHVNGLPEVDRTAAIEGLNPEDSTLFLAYLASPKGGTGGGKVATSLELEDAKEKRVAALQGEAVTMRVDRLEELEAQMREKNRNLEEKDRKIQELEETAKALADKMKEPEKEPQTGDPLVDMAERPLKPTQGETLANGQGQHGQVEEDEDDEEDYAKDHGKAALRAKVPYWLSPVIHPLIDFYIECKMPVEQEMAEDADLCLKRREAQERKGFPEGGLATPVLEDLPDISDVDMFGVEHTRDKRAKPKVKMASREVAEVIEGEEENSFFTAKPP